LLGGKLVKSRDLLRLAPASLLAFGLVGCNRAPSQAILGSYFPTWMICTLIGLALVVVVRQLFVALSLDKALPAPLVVYLALTVAFSFAAWLLWLD